MSMNENLVAEINVTYHRLTIIVILNGYAINFNIYLLHNPNRYEYVGVLSCFFLIFDG